MQVRLFPFFFLINLSPVYVLLSQLLSLSQCSSTLSTFRKKNDNFSLWLYNQIIKCIVSWPTHFHVSLQNAIISLDISMKRQNDAIPRQMERISILSTGYICSICWQFTCSLSLRETKYSYFSIRIIDKELPDGESRLNSLGLLSQIAWIISSFRWNVYCTILYAFSSALLTIFL